MKDLLNFFDKPKDPLSFKGLSREQPTFNDFTTTEKEVCGIRRVEDGTTLSLKYAFTLSRS